MEEEKAEIYAFRFALTVANVNIIKQIAIRNELAQREKIIDAKIALLEK